MILSTILSTDVVSNKINWLCKKATCVPSKLFTSYRQATSDCLLTPSPELEGSALVAPAVHLGIAYKSLPKHTLVWFSKGYSICRVTLPARLARVVKPLHLILVPIWGLYHAYSKWSIAVARMSAGLLSGFFAFTYCFTFIGYNYQASYENSMLTVSLGYSHVQVLPVPHTVFVSVENKRAVTVYSSSPRLGAAFAVALARLRKPNPYTGKGLLPLFRSLRLKKRAGK